MSILLIYFALLLLMGLALSLCILLLIDVLKDHSLATSRRAIKQVFKIVSKYEGDAKNFYDLGCSRGTFAIAIKGRFPHFSVYAIDNSALRLFFARLKNIFFRRKICFQKMNLFETDLRNADIVYTYLWYDLMPPLEKKLQRELKKGAIVITNTSNFPNWKPVKTYVTCLRVPTFEKLFVYIKN